jgi:ribosome biogenesis GTPase
VSGFVVAVDRGRYTCAMDGRSLVAMRARELGRKSVVVGDRVDLVGDTSGDTGALARIVRVHPRRSVLRRTADDDDPTERVIVANVDQMVIVSSLADPPPRTGFIDRCLVAAYDADIEPLLCLTKADLVTGPPPVLDYYADLDLRHVTTRADQPPDQLLEQLTGRLSVLVGHSGVGKSTLVNRFVPGAGRAVAAVRAIGKGRHTSTSAVALRLPDGGWIVDTPGVRSFGLAHVSAASLLQGFRDLAAGAEGCPTDCDHTTAHGECALDGWVAAGNTDPRRLESYRRLLASGTTDE